MRIFICLITIFFIYSCKIGSKKEIDLVKISKKEIEKQVVDIKYKDKLVKLPFNQKDFETSENRDLYPNISSGKKIQIDALISNFKLEKIESDNIVQIKNDMNFDMYVYFISGDSSFSELVNIDPEKGVLDIKSISYEFPEDKTYEVFLITKDYSVIIYEVDYKTESKKILEKYQIEEDGKIKQLFSDRRKVDNSQATAPN